MCAISHRAADWVDVDGTVLKRSGRCTTAGTDTGRRDRRRGCTQGGDGLVSAGGRVAAEYGYEYRSTSRSSPRRLRRLRRGATRRLDEAREFETRDCLDVTPMGLANTCSWFCKAGDESGLRALPSRVEEVPQRWQCAKHEGYSHRRGAAAPASRRAG